MAEIEKTTPPSKSQDTATMPPNNSEQADNELLQLKSTLARLNREHSELRQQIENGERQLQKIKLSTSYRLGNFLLRHAKSPWGWLTFPFHAFSIALKMLRKKIFTGGSYSNDAIKRMKLHNNLLRKASLIGDEKNFDEAYQLVKENGTPEQIMTANLFLANANLNNEEIWLHSVNQYLAKFNLLPLELDKNEKPRMLRVKSAPGYAINEGPLVSIIMPTYNAEKTIEFAASSILSQTWRRLELIIVDDASTDKTWSIIQHIAKNEPRVKIHRSSVNSGPYVSKNLALQFANGDYITGHDADDWALPTRIEHQVAVMRASSKTKACITYMLRFDEQGFFRKFMSIGKTSFDGAARLASISCMFEANAFHHQLGFWDSVRFGADSELIERARILFGNGFKTYQSIGMLCLDVEGSLTNDPVHGIGSVAGGGLSPTRETYRASWMAWHKTLKERSIAKLPFPHSPRLFDAPKEMLVYDSA